MSQSIVQVIVPTVSGVSNPAWFIRWASGYLSWASNADTALAGSMGVKNSNITMGGDQYNRMLLEATAGWDPTQAAVQRKAVGGAA